MHPVQQLAWRTVRAIFGKRAEDHLERALRVYEEACEFAQAAGVDAALAEKVKARVYSRPANPDAKKEMSALGLTAMCWCAVMGVDLLELVDRERKRLEFHPPEYWRARHDAKLADGIVTGKAN